MEDNYDYSDRLYSRRLKKRRTVITTVHIDEDVHRAAKIRLNMSRVCEEALIRALKVRGVDLEAKLEPEISPEARRAAAAKEHGFAVPEDDGENWDE